MNFNLNLGCYKRADIRLLCGPPCSLRASISVSLYSTKKMFSCSYPKFQFSAFDHIANPKRNAISLSNCHIKSGMRFRNIHWKCAENAPVFSSPDSFGFPFSRQEVQKSDLHLTEILQNANAIIPHVVLGSTVLALVYPPSFTWFINRFYAPTLGFLMFAVGINSSVKDFLDAVNKPGIISAGYVGQFFVKPLLGYLLGNIAIIVFNLPMSLGAGIMLVSCVSGAQLSNYATFLTDRSMAPLSIVMTSLSTATAAVMTPILSLLLIGKKIPVDVRGMIFNIIQIVLAPVSGGLLLNRFFPQVGVYLRPFLSPLSVFVTALCVGAPLATNIEAVLSPHGITIMFLVFVFHLACFVAGYTLTGLVFSNESDVKPLQRTLSFETGMQSSLLALALANKFFQDPLVGVPAAISVVIMSLMGFLLVMVWSRQEDCHK